MLTRRTLIQSGMWATASALLARRAEAGGATTALSNAVADTSPLTPIDRRAVVSRHNVIRSKSQSRSPLQVGNGTIAFGADVTGLQTFVRFNTMSQWGWFSAPLPAGQTLADMADAFYPGQSRDIPYDSGDPNHPQITAWSFGNPSRINLARIGLKLFKADGTAAVESDLTEVHQQLDLWTGTLRSRFALEGQTVAVTTVCHPTCDAIAVRVESVLVASAHVSACVDFPSPDNRQMTENVGSSPRPERFPVKVTATLANRIDLQRKLDDDQYHLAIRWSENASVKVVGDQDALKPVIVVKHARFGSDKGWLDATAKVKELFANGHHDPRAQMGQGGIVAAVEAMDLNPPAAKNRRLEVSYTVDGVPRNDLVSEGGIWRPDIFGGAGSFQIEGSANVLEFLIAFSPKTVAADLPDPAAAFIAAVEYWPAFWQSGGAIDLSASTDPRWKELERRIVLSQYLMATNEAGDAPPQESGLVNNGWFGKYHMEMYWWHAAHYALWNRWSLLDKSTGIYEKMLESAKARAAHQGFKGARWTKMTGPGYRNSTVPTNALLIWQQPHPMFFAELEYRARPNRQTLEKWQTVLSEAADFMASYPTLNEQTHKYDLGPSLAPVSENTNYKITRNPTFELSYWRFGLRVAQTWRERLGLPRNAEWDKVLTNLAPLPVEDGTYVTYEGIPQMWTHYNFEHPALTGVLGWLPGDGVDHQVMDTTFNRVMEKWNMKRVWGWDFPMLAMCAARLGHPQQAVDLLLVNSDHFAFDDAGLATGGPFPYFPSNGGLLYAVALMAAGWDGAPHDHPAPGFPTGNGWVVKCEGLSAAI